MEKNPETNRFSTPEAEIAFLREKIRAKELEFKDKKIDFKSDDIIKDQISRYRDVSSKDVLSNNYAIPKTEIESIVLNLAPEIHDKKIEELLGIFNNNFLT